MRMLAVALAGLLFPAWASASRLNYRVGMSVGHSDNIARSPTTPVAATVLAPWVGFALTELTDRWSVQATGDLEHRRYSGGHFDSETRGRVGVRAAWQWVPQRLSWSFEDVLSDQPVNSFAADQPGNRQLANVLVTGPTLALRPSPTMRLLGELRYVNTHAEKSTEFNGDRFGLNVRSLWQLRPDRELSANMESTDLHFDQSATGTRDYRRYDAFLRFSQRGSRLEGVVDAGRSWLRYADSARDSNLSVPALRVRANLDLTDSTRLELRATRQASDAAQDLIDSAPRVEDYALPIGLPDLRPGVVSADVYRERLAGAGIAHRTQSYYVRADVLSRELDYQREQAQDQNTDGWRLAVSRQANARLGLGAFASGEERRYLAGGRTDRDGQVGLNLQWRWTRRLGITLELSRTERDSSDPAQSYTDRRVLFSLSYVR
ncbi:outer membrane beta-barrel protein [Tahibacter amnicola]|uniref:Outer membrane beta-barrel protein n=1 Tax=Tahibacter amnicola TaxID=2976241 RepID=A0ABY6BCJ9_9GAMM|nr:outer membrane beta-barrel protein [Tahibacter amnicola]UXI66341.1 outer membrane beta-barrel protein [Tahibacter amnicola]